MPGTHLTPMERGQIQALILQGLTQAAIARQLGRSESAISRELARNKGRNGRYDATQAQKRYNKVRKNSVRSRSLDHPELRRYVVEKLTEGYSPEQVSNRLWQDCPGQPRMRVSHEAIYRSIYADDRLKRILVPCLRRRRPRRRKRGERRPTRPFIPNRISIEHRPAEVDTEARHGDWEGDLVLGSHQDGAMLTLVERKSMYLRAVPMASKEASVCAEALEQAFEEIPEALRKTLTLDNGSEFARHEQVAQKTSLDVYFAHPYASYERGRIENINGLLRQYYPKKTSFANLDPAMLRRIVDELNNRPRKKLGYRTPNEVFQELTLALET